MVIVSGGGKELGGDLVALERKIQETAAVCDVRLIGPNCIGVFDGHSRMDTFFQVQERLQRPVAGTIAMITQSGTVGCIFLEQAAELGISKFVSYGNRTDVDEADLLAYLADDPETEIIAMYVEGLEDGRQVAGNGQTGDAEEAGRRAQGRPDRAWSPRLPFTHRLLRRILRCGPGCVPPKRHDPGRQHGGTDGSVQSAGNAAEGARQPCGHDQQRRGVDGAGHRPAQNLRAGDARPEPGHFAHAEGLLSGVLHHPEPDRCDRLWHQRDYEAGIEALLRDPNIDIVMPWFVFPDTPLEEDIVQKLGQLNSQVWQADSGRRDGRTVHPAHGEGDRSGRRACVPVG